MDAGIGPTFCRIQRSSGLQKMKARSSGPEKRSGFNSHSRLFGQKVGRRRKRWSPPAPSSSGDNSSPWGLPHLPARRWQAWTFRGCRAATGSYCLNRARRRCTVVIKNSDFLPASEPDHEEPRGRFCPGAHFVAKEWESERAPRIFSASTSSIN